MLTKRVYFFESIGDFAFFIKKLHQKFIKFSSILEAFLEPMLGQNGPLIFTQVCFWTFLCVLKSMWISSNFWYPLEGVFFKGKRESSIGVAENGPPETPFWPQEAPYWIPVGGQQGLQNQLQHNKMNFWPSKILFEMMLQNRLIFWALLEASERQLQKRRGRFWLAPWGWWVANLQELARIDKNCHGVHHSCTPLRGAPDPFALRAIPPPCLGVR